LAAAIRVPAIAAGGANVSPGLLLGAAIHSPFVGLNLTVVQMPQPMRASLRALLIALDPPPPSVPGRTARLVDMRRVAVLADRRRVAKLPR
jgi:hypothetical protein